MQEPFTWTPVPHLGHSPGAPGPALMGKCFFLLQREEGELGTDEMNPISVICSCSGAAQASPPSTPHQVFAAGKYYPGRSLDPLASGTLRDSFPGVGSRASRDGSLSFSKIQQNGKDALRFPQLTRGCGRVPRAPRAKDGTKPPKPF